MSDASEKAAAIVGPSTVRDLEEAGLQIIFSEDAPHKLFLVVAEELERLVADLNHDTNVVKATLIIAQSLRRAAEAARKLYG